MAQTAANFEMNVTRQNPGVGARLAAEIKAESNKYVRGYARAIRREARSRAAVLTGRMKRSIKTKKIAEGHYEVIVDVYYGKYVEYGTRYMHAQPFLTPAVERVKKTRTFRARLGSLIRRARK